MPDLPGIAHRIFSALAERHINVDMIVQTASRGGSADISFTVTKADAAAAEETTRAVAREIGGGEVVAGEDVAKVSIVGAGMASNPGVAVNDVRRAGRRGHEHPDDQHVRDQDFLYHPAADDVQKAVRAVHRAFNLDAMR